LRERKEDIPLLIEHFIKLNNARIELDDTILSRFIEYNWPGNVRQLYNAVSRIATFVKKPVVTIEDVPSDIFQPGKQSAETTMTFNGVESFNLQEAIHNLEEKAINWALKKTDGNKKRAAELLGLKRSTFLDRMKNFNVSN